MTRTKRRQPAKSGEDTAAIAALGGDLTRSGAVRRCGFPGGLDPDGRIQHVGTHLAIGDVDTRIEGA
jgi:hypothetical protein